VLPTETLSGSSGTADSRIGAQLAASSKPRSRHAHWQILGDHAQLFVVNGSRIFDVDYDVIDQLNRASSGGDGEVVHLLGALGLLVPPLINDAPLESPPLHALSLAVAQKCNLGCAYCYASQGDFGGVATNMTWQTAQRAVDLLIQGAGPGGRVNLAFLGGEPLANREIVRSATEYASSLGKSQGVHVGFSITTNGTLLTESDADFFEQHKFAVTISLDGLREDHDRQRPFKNGVGSFDRTIDRARPLLSKQRNMQVSVRATVAPGNLRLRESLDFFLGMNFHSVGFSPVLRSPTGRGEMAANDLMNLLEAMVDCGMEFERRILRGERYAFMNIVNALHEIHKGTHRPYPCGAGAGYLGVSAEGDLSACHRFVGDKQAQMGNLVRGIDPAGQNRWLADRHVHQQVPCGECWARYLCSGGCHHETIARGRTACDYIRGWLHHCLQAYDRVLKLRPEWFGEEPASVTGGGDASGSNEV
jgi:uncharacterized protein